MRGHDPNLRQGKLRLGIRKNFFTEWVIKHWSDVQQSGGGTVQEVFKDRLGEAPRAVVVRVRSQFHSMIPQVFSSLFDPLILRTTPPVSTPRKNTGMLRPLHEGFPLCSRREECSVCLPEGGVLCQNPALGKWAAWEM